jgi:hypothetical protein
MIVRGRGTPTYKRFNSRYELLLLSLSSYILKRSIPETFPESKRLALHPCPSNEAVKVHCLMHSYTLSKHTRQHSEIYGNTQHFAKLLNEKDKVQSQKERSRKQNIDIPQIHNQCSNEISRWTQNWTAIKAEYILTSLSSTLSPLPPTEFLSQSYDNAFKNIHPRTPPPSTSPIIQSSKSSQTTMTQLIQLEKELTLECARLEALVSPPGPRKTGSLRKSLPPTTRTPEVSPRKREGLHFTRSMERLVRSVSESPRAMRMDKRHCITLSV